ncbi:UNVERIFIED_ORG: hypothetical protein M2438_005332 [Methylobacterium sp. SuP10 SLI 274]|uniref:hypothetical protein n=1 Tax=Methylorubrum extorquens TaxID=408 RepID=UPI001477C3F0|nr:hypothetical protein [Methylorubrum extorquens]MDF9861082.1 hypothetical protein [Methylorubrum pseudosasae]MDH6640086.1 hypothetical protein [Methylobacterium sp. SuP10 SLI 274]MDH6669156.1 hypothetical protein [Methylorubrum zatmanii]MCP1556656.1 hypothetical protein [Methylorubrum extorquens]MDF9789421.1 hypothetical protein [Methylorubrum extorquens]
MSRYEFDQPGVSLAIGWDAPLSTFYLQIWNEALHTAEMDDEERASPQIWFGTEYAEHLSPSLLLTLARQHLPSLPEDIEESLMRDMVKEPARPLSADHAEIRLMLEALLGEGPSVMEAPQRTPDETARLEMEALLKGTTSETRRQ